MARVTGNEASFATAVLQGLGAPVTQPNLDFIEKWITREGGGGANNPLNTTQAMSGATDFNTVGVKNYADLDTGVQATLKTLLNGRYPNIVAALKTGNAEQADAAGKLAKDLSTWSGGGYTSLSGVTARPTNAIGSAGTTAGGASTGTGLGGAGDQATYGDIDGFLQSQAPALAAAMNDPEVKKLLQSWGSGQLSDQEFQNQLEATHWWKNTPQSQRTLLASQATDPATAQQNLQNQMASVDSLAWSKGIKLTPDLEYKIALDSIKNQWSNQQILQQVVASNQTQYTTGGKFGGEAASDVEQIKSLYASYALPVNDQQLNADVANVLAGKGTVADLEQQVAEQAATFYSANPQLASFLQSGKGSAAQWAAPLVTQVANILGVNPSTIDLISPQYSFLLKPQTNPQTGQSLGQAQTLDSVEQKIKTDPVFGYTRTANGVAETQQMRDKFQAAFTGGGVA